MEKTKKQIPLFLVFGLVSLTLSLLAEVKTHLSYEEIQKEEEKIRELLVDKTIYDVDVELEEVGVGYNIVVRNRADEDSLKSFVDPTMVALVLGAWHTETTDWKSDTLKVWIRTSEGWGVLTKDCRKAERAATNWYLGMSFGVNPYKFRKQLESKFFKLEPPQGARGTFSWLLPLILGIVAFLALCAAILLFLLWKGFIKLPKAKAIPKLDQKQKPETEDSKEEKLEAKFCPECDAPLKPKAKFCPQCGERFNAQ